MNVANQLLAPAHFDGARYFNPDGSKVRGFRDLLKWQLASRREVSPRFVEDVEPSIPPECVEGPELRVTLVNHSTVLLQDREAHILTDPMWKERASPFPWIGPRRHRAPGVRFEDLPRIDVVLLSHNHYDHLDIAALRRLAEREKSQFVVPAKLGPFLRSRGLAPVHELDWGECVELEQTIVHAVPALHFSGRGLSDRNRTLWCGYVVEQAGRIIYFAGDTAYGSHFAAIRERFGPPHLALLPIGAYEPRWFMSPVHMGPDEAVRAHRVLGGGASIAIHHGTFQLADEAIDTPRRVLAECLNGESFHVLNNGQAIAL